MSLARFVLPTLALSLALSGCNSGLGTIFSSSDDSSSNSPSSVSGFAILGGQASPTDIRFRLLDGDALPVQVSLFFELPGETPKLLTALGGAENPAEYDSSSEGIEHTLTWDFAAEPDLPSDASYIEDVTVFAQITGAEALLVGTNATLQGLGNDAPVVEMVGVPSEEAAGVVPIGLRVADSSTDLVAIKVEFRAEGETKWQLARPGGVSNTPELAFAGLSAPADGVSVNFFWDTNVDLPNQERNVQLRMTASDPTVAAAPVLSDVFRIDNNAQSLVLLDNGLIAVNPDTVGGIAIPFRLRDTESDDARIIMQWRRPGQAFPELPSDPAEALALQADARSRAEYQICSERVAYFGGRPKEVDATHIRLPELGTSDVPVATPDLVGRALEIMRATEAPHVVSDDWDANPLTSVLDVQPLGDGLEVLALDSPSGSNWRLQQLELATGNVTQAVAQGRGAATAFAMSDDHEIAFVASFEGAAWQIDRVDTAAGKVTHTATGTFAEAGAIRGIAACSSWTAAITVDDKLQRVLFAQTPPAVHTVLDNLSTPSGLVCDPLARDHVLVAESGADRVVNINLNKPALEDVLLPDPSTTPVTPQLSFPSPTAIALDRNGVRLLVVTDSAMEGRQLRAMNRRSTHDIDGTGSANSFVYVLADLTAGSGTGIGTGPDNLRVLANTAASSLTAIGGLEQRRTILEAVPTDNVVTLEAPLAPDLAGPHTWRVRRKPVAFKSTPGGVNHVFPWDSRDVVRGGSVLFRAVPIDSEFGLDSTTSLERAVTSSVGVRSITIDENLDGGVAIPSVIDFDRDGDLDVFISEGADSRVILQTGKGVFDDTPTSLGVDLSGSVNAKLLLEDLDGDGFLDLVHARADLMVDIFAGNGPGTFDPVPTQLTLSSPAELFTILTIEAGDMDSDGDLDLIITTPNNAGDFSTGVGDDFIAIYYQLAPGTFDPIPTLIGDQGVIDLPWSIHVADIDGDGRTDLVSADDSFGSGSDLGLIAVHFQEADGSYDPMQTVTFAEPDPFVPSMNTTGNPRAIASADLDNDGDLDLIVAHGRPNSVFQSNFPPLYSRQVTVFWQVSPRVFDPSPLVLRPAGFNFGTGRCYGVSVADVDNNGALDIAVQDVFGLSIFFANEPAQFEATPLLLEYQAPFSTNDPVPSLPTLPIEPADLDGDGDLDFVFLDISTNKVVAYLQTKEGVESFGGDPKLFQSEGDADSTIGANDVVSADLDSDGDLDFAISTGGLGFFAANDLKAYFQIAPRSFESIPLQLTGSPPGQVPAFSTLTRVESADMDQDGDRDLLLVSVGTNEAWIFWQEPAGVFDTSLILDGVFTVDPVSPLINSLCNLSISDLDDDGDLDLIGLPNEQQRVIGYEQIASGAFVEAFEIGKPGADIVRGTAMAPADLDGDGDLELITANGETGNLHIFEGEGPFSFVDEPQLLADGGSNDLIVHDIDGDGDLDLISTLAISPVAAVLKIHLRTDAGTYEVRERAVMPNTIGAATVAPRAPIIRLIDFDRDGDLDLGVLSGGAGIATPAGNLILIEQLAPGVFATEPSLSVPMAQAPAIALRFEDVDGDGEFDALLPNARIGTGEMRILWGNE